MKERVLLAFLVILLGVGFTYSQTITVTSPHTGDTWTKGQKYTIRWTKSGSMSNFVKIRLYQGNTKVLGIVDRTDNDGSFDWTVPDTINTGTYRIRIKTVDNQIYDDSENFAISGASQNTGKIEIMLPKTKDGLFLCYAGEDCEIKWRKTGQMASTVNITVIQAKPYHEISIANSTPNDGSYTWRIPPLINNNLPAGTFKMTIETTDHKVRASTLFFISSGSIKIISPKRGDFWYGGKTYEIEWETRGSLNNMPLKIELYKGNAPKWEIVSNLRHTNKVPFYVPAESQVEDGYYYLKIRTTDDQIGDETLIGIGHPKVKFLHPQKNSVYFKEKEFSAALKISGFSKNGVFELHNKFGKVMEIARGLLPPLNGITYISGKVLPRALSNGFYFIRLTDGQVSFDSEFFVIVDNPEDYNFPTRQKQQMFCRYLPDFEVISFKAKVKNRDNFSHKPTLYEVTAVVKNFGRSVDRDIFWELIRKDKGNGESRPYKIRRKISGFKKGITKVLKFVMPITPGKTKSIEFEINTSISPLIVEVTKKNNKGIVLLDKNGEIIDLPLESFLLK